MAVWGVHALAEPQWGQELLLQLRTGFQMGLPRFLLWKLSLPAPVSYTHLTLPTICSV